MSQEYDVGPFKKIFKSYHNCHETPAIVHGNGDSMIYEYWKVLTNEIKTIFTSCGNSSQIKLIIAWKV